MRRREFVRRLPVVASGLAAGVAGLPLAGCAGVPYVVPTPRPGGALAVPSSALVPDGGVFVQAPGMERPVYLTRGAGGDPVAVLASCTHRGCQPEPVGDRLVCPCHGSEFSLSGSVLQGPADRPLTRYVVTETGGELLVDLSSEVSR